jgi:hypothetical protein
MSRNERAVRFAVGRVNGLRSEVWKCWTPGGGNSDIYLAPRTIGGQFKLSAHDAEVVNLGFTREFKDHLIAEGRWFGGSRLTHRHPFPEPTVHGARLLHSVLVPAGAATVQVPAGESQEDICWLPSPSQGLVSQTTILVVPAGTAVEAPPADLQAPIGLVGRFPLDSGDEVWLIHLEAPIPQLGTKTGSPAMFRPPPEISNDLSGYRVLVPLEIDGRPIAILETVVNDKRPGRGPAA